MPLQARVLLLGMAMSSDAHSPFPPAGGRLPDVRQIAVLRANAVGDFIVTLPALTALKRAYPHAELVLLGKRWHADFLRERSGPVDQVIELPAVPGVSVDPNAPFEPGAVQALVDRLRARRFDLAVQLHGGGRYSNPFVRRLGARLSVGLCAPDAEPLDRNLPYVDDHHPVSLQLLECVGLAGATSAPLEPQLALRPGDVAEAAAVVPPTPAPLLVLQPGASHAQKRWAPERFAAVGDAFAERGAVVAVHGSAPESALTSAVCRAMRQPAIDLAGRLSVGGLAGLLARARLLVSNDTGPVHLARALGTPTVAIFWVANVRSFGPLSTRTQRVATSWRMNCPLCGRNAMTDACPHEVSLVDDVPVQAVLELADSLWDDCPGDQGSTSPGPENTELQVADQ
ncbi:glycosyltransferase family 9 protein [Ideonella sp. BN130291]|uniref:glycosyltransferase family 9 protein n=1 Tax=Ideonella sp. BN130291 TaxID=3112940 RepID=UPI002E270E70|nr:glycosyltransferase family 9 protein [Ideonella sp. BN130291]